MKCTSLFSYPLVLLVCKLKQSISIFHVSLSNLCDVTNNFQLMLLKRSVPALPDMNEPSIPSNGTKRTSSKSQWQQDLLFDQLLSLSGNPQQHTPTNQYLRSSSAMLDDGSTMGKPLGGDLNHAFGALDHQNGDINLPTSLPTMMSGTTVDSGLRLASKATGPRRAGVQAHVQPPNSSPSHGYAPSTASDQSPHSDAPNLPQADPSYERRASRGQPSNRVMMGPGRDDRDSNEAKSSKCEIIQTPTLPRNPRGARPAFDSRNTAPEPLQRISDEDEKLETRIERVLESLRRAGFQGFEQFAIQYFTADLDEDSPAFTAQSLSRSRYLRELLAALSRNAQNWSTREAQGFRDEIVRSAEQEYTQELRLLTEHMKRDTVPSPALQDSGIGISPRLENLMANLDIQGGVKQRKKQVQEEVRPAHRLRCSVPLTSELQAPELWSLLMQLVGHTALPPPRRSEIVYSIISIITACDAVEL